MDRNTFNELISYMESSPIINTHSHHREDAFFPNLNLDMLLKTSYIEWCGETFGDKPETRSRYLEKVRYNSYFIWLEKALQQLYHFNDPITAENWDKISGMISESNKQAGNHLDVLKCKCRYEKIILDAYWDPGSTNDHPELFAPTFRTNMFHFGYSSNAYDFNGTNPIETYKMNTKDIDEYVFLMRNIIIEKKNAGCVALKSAIAYDRSLDFSETSKDRAQKALSSTDDTITAEDIKAFGDFIFFEICRIAAELDMPFQCHTGLGLLKRTNALQMQEVIQKNPETKFVLFHGGYPWLEDIYALAHFYKNIYPDICWLPIISTSAAERMVEELIEISMVDRICWGCDTWTSEESLGALLAAKHAIAQALAKKVQAGYFSMNDAEKIIDNILYNNAKSIYRL